MKLEPKGRKRLDSMKKTLAAGLPLAGLLAGAATVGAAAQGCGYCVPGIVVQPSPPQPEEWRVRARSLPEEPETPDIPEGTADAPAEEAAP